MKIKIALITALFAFTALMFHPVSAAGPITAQDMVKTLITLGILNSGEGALVLEVPEKRLDLSNDDNTFAYEFFNENSLVNFVMGGTITWGPGAAEDDCGYVLRMKDEANYFYVALDQLQRVHYDEINAGVWQDPLYYPAPQIVNGANRRNELVVVWHDNVLTTLVNGQVVAQRTDSTLVEGYIGIGMDTFASSAATSCTFSNLWVWQLQNATGAAASAQPGSATLSSVQVAPEQAVAELQSQGLVPSGGSMVFQPTSADFGGEGFWYTPLAEDQAYTNVVMAGDLTFTPGTTSDTETCTLLARAEISTLGMTSAYFEVGLNNDGNLYAVDMVVGLPPAATYFAEQVDLSQPHHILFILNDNTLTLFFDGQMVANQHPINDPRAGSYALSLNSKTAATTCQISNVWVYQMD